MPQDSTTGQPGEPSHQPDTRGMQPKMLENINAEPTDDTDIPDPEDGKLLLLGSASRRHLTAHYTPSIDEIIALRTLQIIPGTEIRSEQQNQQPQDLQTFIKPAQLGKFVDGIRTWRLEIALLQLQWQYDAHLNPNAQETAAGLNNLGCVSALLGRYQKAKEYLEHAAGLLPNDTKIKDNKAIIDKVSKVLKNQRYWGNIGGQR